MGIAWTFRRLGRAGFAALVLAVCAISLVPGTSVAYGRRCPVERGAKIVDSSSDVVVTRVVRSEARYVACWRPTARRMTLLHESRKRFELAPKAGVLISGRWVVVEQSEGRSCDALRTVRSLDVLSGKQGYVVSTHTCRIGSSGNQDATGTTSEGPWPPTVLDNGPAPTVRDEAIVNIAVATNGDFAWAVAGETYAGSFDRGTFGPVASGLFVPAGNRHDTNLSIVGLPSFPVLHIEGDVVSWTQFGAALAYTMPAPGTPVLPITIQGSNDGHAFTPSPPVNT